MMEENDYKKLSMRISKEDLVDATKMNILIEGFCILGTKSCETHKCYGRTVGVIWNLGKNALLSN